MSVLKSQKSVPWARAVTQKAASNVCVQMGSPCPPLEEGAKICERATAMRSLKEESVRHPNPKITPNRNAAVP